MKNILVGVLAVVMLAGTALVDAKDRDRGRDHGELRKMAKELDLTKEQRDEIRGLMKTAKGGKRSKLAARDVKSLDVTAKDYDQQVTLLAEKAATEARERVVQRGELQKKVHAILTDKQKVKYKALREERKQKMIKRYEEKIEQIRQ